jgi:exodeoxyribonuclease VII large subunit
VTAIGHEPDTPLVDYVADLRCSTPTEAGRRLVPDLAEELDKITTMRDRARRALAGWVDRERRLLDALRSRPALADPMRPLDERIGDVRQLLGAARLAVERRVSEARTDLEHLRTRLTSLGPAATLARGYAVVQRVPEHPGSQPLPVLRSVTEAPPGTRLRVRLADGALNAVVDDE